MLIGGAYTSSRSSRLLRPVTLQKYNTLVDSFSNDNKKKRHSSFALCSATPPPTGYIGRTGKDTHEHCRLVI